MGIFDNVQLTSDMKKAIIASALVECNNIAKYLEDSGANIPFVQTPTTGQALNAIAASQQQGRMVQLCLMMNELNEDADVSYIPIGMNPHYHVEVEEDLDEDPEDEEEVNEWDFLHEEVRKENEAQAALKAFKERMVQPLSQEERKALDTFSDEDPNQGALFDPKAYYGDKESLDF